jgi:DNA polymerase-3 subunit delta
MPPARRDRSAAGGSGSGGSGSGGSGAPGRPAPRRETAVPAHLVTGDDPSLVSQALGSLLDELTAGSAAGSAVIEGHEVQGRDEPLAIGAVLDACSTPPLFSERRIVVVRDAALLDAAQAKALAEYLSRPLETTVLVLAAVLLSASGSRRSVPAPLVKAVRAVGRVVDVSPGTGRARAQWLSDRIAASGLQLDRAASERLAAHLGDDLGRLDGLLASLTAAYGEHAHVHESDLEPFLGSEGGAAPWDLTDALDAGDGGRALEVLRRLLGAGERHPVQVLGGLHRHYAAMLRLDGVEGVDEAGAAALTGLSPYPARKALSQCRRLGHERLVQAIELLAAADLDVRGVSGLPPAVVLEILVARLSRLSRARPASTSPRGAGRATAAARPSTRRSAGSPPAGPSTARRAARGEP